MKDDYDPATVALVRYLAEKGLTGPQIAAQIPGFSRQTVQHLAKRHGIDVTRCEDKHKNRKPRCGGIKKGQSHITTTRVDDLPKVATRLLTGGGPDISAHPMVDPRFNGLGE